MEDDPHTESDICSWLDACDLCHDHYHKSEMKNLLKKPPSEAKQHLSDLRELKTAWKELNMEVENEISKLPIHNRQLDTNEIKDARIFLKTIGETLDNLIP